MSTVALEESLIVADQPDASVLSAGLKRAGCQYRVVPSCSDVYSEVQRGHVSVIVFAESSLPKCPSMLFQTLRCETLAPFVVAGWGGADERTEMLLDGADVYLERPIPDEILRARLASLSTRRVPLRRKA